MWYQGWREKGSATRGSEVSAWNSYMSSSQLRSSLVQVSDGFVLNSWWNPWAVYFSVPFSKALPFLGVVGWPQPAGKLLPTCSLTAPLVGWGTESGGWKWEKIYIFSQYKYRLRTEGEKKRNRNQALQMQSLTTSRSSFDYFGKTPHLIVGMKLCGVEYHFSQLKSAVPGGPPPSLLPTPAYTLWGQSEKQKALMLCKDCLATAKKWV